MSAGKVVELVAGPCHGKRIHLSRFPEILKVPVNEVVEGERDIYRHPEPPTEMRVTWYRRRINHTTIYDFDRYE